MRSSFLFVFLISFLIGISVVLGQSNNSNNSNSNNEKNFLNDDDEVVQEDIGDIVVPLDSESNSDLISDTTVVPRNEHTTALSKTVTVVVTATATNETMSLPADKVTRTVSSELPTPIVASTVTSTTTQQASPETKATSVVVASSTVVPATVGFNDTTTSSASVSQTVEEEITAANVSQTSSSAEVSATTEPTSTGLGKDTRTQEELQAQYPPPLGHTLFSSCDSDIRTYCAPKVHPPYSGYSIFGHSCFQHNVQNFTRSCSRLGARYTAMHPNTFDHMAPSSEVFRQSFISYDVVDQVCGSEFRRYCPRDSSHLRFFDANYVFKNICFKRSVMAMSSECSRLYKRFYYIRTHRSWDSRPWWVALYNQNPMAISILIVFIFSSLIYFFVLLLKRRHMRNDGEELFYITNARYLEEEEERERRAYEESLPETTLPSYKRSDDNEINIPMVDLPSYRAHTGVTDITETAENAATIALINDILSGTNTTTANSIEAMGQQVSRVHTYMSLDDESSDSDDSDDNDSVDVDNDRQQLIDTESGVERITRATSLFSNFRGLF